jgi:hypothetical protein
MASAQRTAHSPPDFWDLASGKRPDVKIVVTPTERAANWGKQFGGVEAKRHFNARTLHAKESAAGIADNVQKIAHALDDSGSVGTTYKQYDFPGHMYPARNPIGNLPACIKAYLLEHTDDLDMSSAAPGTVMPWVCRCFAILDDLTCDRREFAEQEAKPEEWAKEHINAVWTSESKRRGPKWEGFRRFESHVHNARARLFETPELKPIRDYVQTRFKPGKNKSLIGSFASHVYMFVVGKLLHAVQKRLASQGATVQTLEYDGLKVTKGLDEAVLIETARVACEEVCPGIDAKWKVKPPNTEIKDAGEKKGSGYHLDVNLENYAQMQEDITEGPPVEELTEADLQDMKRTFHTLGIEWESCAKPRVGAAIANEALEQRLASGKFKFTRSELQQLLLTGLSWAEVGPHRPTTGTQLTNGPLAKALGEGKTDFEAAEFAAFDVEDLAHDSFACANGVYYQLKELEESNYIVVQSTFFRPIRSVYNYRWCKAAFEKRFVQVDNMFADKLNVQTDGDKVGVNGAELVAKFRDLKYVDVDDLRSKKSFLTEWLNDEGKASFDKFCFVPPGATISTTGKFNLFTPWAGLSCPAPDSIDEAVGYLLVIVNHLKRIIANNDPHQFRLVMFFYAQMLQHPQFKSLCLVFVGEEGCGKTTAMKFVRNMVGRNKFYSTSSPENNVWGKFNAIILSKYFVELAEINKSNMHNQREKVLQFLEDDTIPIEFKGVDSKVCESFHHCCVNTNNRQPVFHSRRFGPVRCSDEMAIPESCSACLMAPSTGQEHCAACTEKKQYHATTNETVENPKAVRAATEFFLHAIDDCPKKLTRDYVVQSEQTDLIKEGSTDSIDGALRFLIKTKLERDPSCTVLQMTTEEIFQQYQNYCEEFERGERSVILGFNSFKSKLGCKSVPGMTNGETRHHNGKHYPNKIKVKRLDTQLMAEHLKVDVGVKNQGPIVEAFAEEPALPRNRQLPPVWTDRFENTEEWVRSFVLAWMGGADAESAPTPHDRRDSHDGEHDGTVSEQTDNGAVGRDARDENRPHDLGTDRNDEDVAPSDQEMGPQHAKRKAVEATAARPSEKRSKPLPALFIQHMKGKGKEHLV